jgi:hypothetical protein
MACLLLDYCLRGLFFDLDDGGSIFLETSVNLSNYTELYLMSSILHGDHKEDLKSK